MATMACSRLREAWGQPRRMVHALARPAPSSDQDQSDADHQVADTVGATGRLGAVAQAERGLPPVPRNVVGEITSLVAPPGPSRAYGRDVGEVRMRERGIRIKMRNPNA
jgi:hypothetical protein